MNTTEENVANYIKYLDDPEIAELAELISKHLPNVKPKLWRGKFWGGTEQTIIGYGDLTYTRSDKKEVKWFMVGLARQKNHISLYISARGKDGYLANEYAKNLGKVKVGAGRLSFSKLSDIDQKQLSKLLNAVHEQINKQRPVVGR
ncbi:DUF1801 domain-containing protein [Patescibacteria group bacterium]|nr:MAG: DUF1801 domain-containing protein [Patescibacteria group bacterium]